MPFGLTAMTEVFVMHLATYRTELRCSWLFLVHLPHQLPSPSKTVLLGNL